ncbi:hypothetical protein [Paraclostridium sordellii]|uniref:hypothetical protein n=1 Tax=Paraclostridium sordellii TaxID=1505 RepID=UPI0005E974E5|nr:hypothetical protein [Paeniclostridium sordellii]CEP42259.1 Uncharacterised protein [[Clostridium] sordellii] [Paeniclostridium sordellii]CEP43047.1 Uncharacterised protein [[Clostridium] sordellii] [Paeniclostridium sordellii]
MKISDEKRKKFYKFINILEVKKRIDKYEVIDGNGNITKCEDIKGLDIVLNLYEFKNLNLYIPGMNIIDEYLMKDYIIENLEAIFN